MKFDQCQNVIKRLLIHSGINFYFFGMDLKSVELEKKNTFSKFL